LGPAKKMFLFTHYWFTKYCLTLTELRTRLSADQL